MPNETESLRLLRELPAPVVVFCDDRLRFINLAALTFRHRLGFDQGETVLDSSIRSWFEQPDELQAAIDTVQRSQRPLTALTLLMRDAAGLARSLSCSLACTHYEQHAALLLTWPMSPIPAELSAEDNASLIQDVWASLSPRQQEILRCLRAGLDTRKIAENMQISVGTVRVQLRIMFRRTGTHSRVELVRRLFESEQSQPSPQAPPDSSGR
ncbi:MAG: helix-turn-helix transcriptional regulator [Myxococcota bacterium]|jgi:DNA-binding NarL/FixJ family response regulator|nr:helix-turn-helix transcriptional regulator [Myxococcota bacterium]